MGTVCRGVGGLVYVRMCVVNRSASTVGMCVFIPPQLDIHTHFPSWDTLQVGVCGGVYVWMCVVNIVNPAVDWPPLLHTLTDRD